MTAVPGSAAPPGFPPSPAPGHGRPFTGDNPARRPAATAADRVKPVRYPAADFPPLRPGSTLGAALAQALRQGRPLLPAVDAEGRLVGVFDLPAFVGRLTPRGKDDLDAPAGPALAKAAAVVAPGYEEAWFRDGASENAIVVDGDGRYAGVLFRDADDVAPPPADRVDVWLRQLAEGVLGNVSYMVAVSDADGRAVLANAEMRRFFGAAWAAFGCSVAR